MKDAEAESQYINTTPRLRRQNGEDVTTVLLVDSQGRSTFGRFLSVKPDLGLLTSTARTFIQEGVTTEYATQVLGTTLDNGRLYAHLLTKSSRVRYDNDQQPATKSNSNTINPTKKWNIDVGNIGDTKSFVKNTDYISPNHVEPFIVFPTTKPKSYKFFKEGESEELKSSPSNNPRQPYVDSSNRESKFIAFSSKNKQNNKNPSHKNFKLENDINYKESSENDIPKRDDLLDPSKVREWNDLPTFTVRNKFSPSGYSYLGDFPEFEINTEKSKSTTASERKAKLLFRPNLEEKRNLKTVTYTGFADFTTTVGDTVIIFSPSTVQVEKQQTGHVTKIKGEPTLQTTLLPTLKKPNRVIHPTLSIRNKIIPTLTTQNIPRTTTESQEVIENETEHIQEEEEQEEEEEETDDIWEEEESEEEHTTKHFTMVLDSTDRPHKQSEDQKPTDHDAKLSVLANEQKDYLQTPQIKETLTTTDGDIITYSSDAIEPSESQTPQMLSTPSFEDIAKILASLQANKMESSSSVDEDSITSVATEPLNTKSTIFADEEQPETTTQTEDSISVLTGAKTIFFDDFFPTALDDTTSSSTVKEVTTTPLTTTSEQENIVTTEKLETTEAVQTTPKEPVTNNEILKDDEFSTIPIQETTPPEIKKEADKIEKPTDEIQLEDEEEEKEENETDIVCTTGEKIVATTSYQTFNLLTTFYIPDGDSTSTSIKSGTSISTEIGFQTVPCGATIEPSSVLDIIPISKEAEIQNEQDITESDAKLKLEPTTEPIITTESIEETTPMLTTPFEITTERQDVTESDAELTETTTESGEEIELVVKTLYTTFNYLTTYYFGDTSSISTSKTIATNVVTSTVYPGQEDSIEPSSVVLDNLKTPISFDDLALSDMEEKESLEESEEDDEEEEDDGKIHSTPSLDDSLSTLPYKIKTYFTTYTYFSTIFDGEDDSRVLSRTEVRSSVYTDYGLQNIDATPAVEIKPTDILEGLLTTEKDADDELSYRNLRQYNTTINSRQRASNSEEQTELYDSTTDNIDNNILPTVKSKSYSTLLRAPPVLESSKIDSVDLSEYEIISNMVTNVRSTTSKGDTKVLENVDKRNVLDDQVFSESNNESEILASPTLLLQTSYTTFTYFTTTYHGTTASDVVSSLKTITNVVTETLTPQTLRPDDIDAPITYFTTFTYWTTSVKKNTTIVKSSEKTITNIETHTPVITDKPTISILPTSSIEIDPTPIVETLYSTFTYYTTSYFGDNNSTVYSSLATSSEVVTKTPKDEKTVEPTAVEADSVKSNEKEPTGLISTIVETLENSGTKTVLSTDIYGTYISGKYAQVQERTFSILTDAIEPTKAPEINLKPTGVLSINKGRIVDAEGVSTLFYTTQALGTYIDDSYAQVIDSTSSIAIDEEKKKNLATDLPLHRTGLVRIIEGTIVQNETTTLYHSNVFGTLIGGNYAQVIESTSSFIVGKKASITPTSVQEIVPGPTQAPETKIQSKTPITPSPVVIEGSLSESVKSDEENSTEDDDEEDTTEKNNKSKNRSDQKKNTYTQPIRPFTTPRNGRPSFFPPARRKSASTVTRSDVVPTVTAIPARRFSGGRKSSNNINVISPTSSRRFLRPKSSVSAISSSGYGGGRRSSSRIQPTSAFTSSKRSNFRSSAKVNSAAIYNLKQRIRPTAALGFSRFASSATTPINDDENELTTYTENPTAYTDDDAAQTLPTTTELTTKGKNPLFRFRRPPLSRPSTTPRSQKTTKNNRPTKTATTTAKPRTFNRPQAAVQNRARPVNALFPRRGLFTTTTTPSPEEEDEEFEEDIDDLEHEDADLDESDYDNSDGELQTQSPSQRIGRSFSPAPVQIRPFIRRRNKRQVQYSRFRRPGIRTTTTPKEEPTTETTTPPRAKTNRFITNRRKSAEHKTTTQAPNKRLSPTKASQQGRSQFTLRDSNRSSFKPQTPTRKISSRPTAPKLNKGNQYNNDRGSRPRGSTTHKSPTRRPSRRPTRVNEVDNFVLPSFDGTITVTHQIPTEVTIPVVNGKITEYKNIVTAKYSIEVLGPSQYTTSINQYGKDVTVLLAESTGIANNGATQVTQFILNETPTSSVIFTPTYIRGRKTSYSHVVPSTVYAVEEIVSTLQPSLGAVQAPLANILLSQLLLGNVGFGQPNLPIPFGNPGVPAVPGTPTTEFKTRTTTYVTTVTKQTSTVLPLTFRGKEILTTIVDSSTEVITATEFLTDTVVVTPTPALQQFGGGNQLNSLLVPLLLQQQQQQQQQNNPLLQAPAGVFNLESLNQPLNQPLNQQLNQQLAPQLTQPLLQNDRYNNIDNDRLIEDEPIKEEPVVTEAPKPRKGRKRPKKPTPTPPPKETSIVTLYVSGRQPGEFTTVLSTYIVGEESRRKRDVQYIPVQASKVIEVPISKSQEVFHSYVMPTNKEFEEEDNLGATQSLESILGDVNKHITSSAFDLKTKPTKTVNQPSKNTVDLYETAPLIPKVIKIDLPGGNLEYPNSIANLDNNKFRIKRDLNETSPRPRRVVKKLISVRPHSLSQSSSDKIITKSINLNGTSSTTNNTNLERKRKIIKIRRKKRPTEQNSNNGNNEHEAQSSKRRRKVIIKKRLKNKATAKPLEIVTENNLDSVEEAAMPKEIDDVEMTKNEKALVNSLFEDELLKSNERDGRKLDFEETKEDEGPTRLQISLNNENFYEDGIDHEIIGSFEYEDSNPDQYIPIDGLHEKSNFEYQFPELSESIENSSLNLKTTVIWSTEYETKTSLQSKNKTYTFVVTRVNGDEQIVTSSTEVLPHTKTITLTEPVVKYTTLTILDLDAQDTLPSTTPTMSVTPENNTQEGRWLEEARYNLATRVMSNGVEVIVAGDKSTLPGDPDSKRIRPTSVYKPVTLKPSTLSDHMMMALPPEDATDIGIHSTSLYPNQFVTKTCLTTFTYLTTYVEDGTTEVSSHVQVVSNIATEERNTGKVVPTPTMGITLTQYPKLSVGIFPTTYTYFNTIMDGDKPLVVQSKHTVTNTVTAPDDYLSLLKPVDKASVIKDTNTYHSTITLKKTLYENDETKVINTEEVVTQVVITESIPPKATSVMTSYIALDVEDPGPSQGKLMTTDVVKTYYITYTYFNTLTENGHSYVQTNVSTSTDVVTEKLYLHPKRTSAPAKITSTPSVENLEKKQSSHQDDFEILATKTYLTTFTSRTTMISQEPGEEDETVVNSRYRVVGNVVTETIDSSLFDNNYLDSIKEEMTTTDILTKMAMINGQKMEVTFVNKDKIKPTNVLPIEKTKMPDLMTKSAALHASSGPSIITGSTIVFVDEDDDPFKLAASEPTPVIVSSKIAKTTTLTNNLNNLLSSEIVTKASKNSKRHTNKETISSSKPSSTTSSKLNKEPVKKKPVDKITRPTNSVSDLLGLGSININRLTPVLNVMADLLQTNLKKSKNETISTTTKPKIQQNVSVKPKTPLPSSQSPDTQNRSPIYIPVGGFTDIEVAESQNIASFQINEHIPWSDTKHEAIIGGKLSHESPLLNGGIPISPGEIITANSDVIVGKPGRVGPRIPAIPLHDVNKVEEAPIGMKPPPRHIQNDFPNDFPQRQYETKPIPVRHEKPIHPILHAPNKDDYIGPPPPIFDKNEEHNKISLLPPPQIDSFDFNGGNLQDSIPNESSPYKNYPPAPVVLGTPINDFNIKPSIINQPIVLPEVIERSTGQPLLVNIQPSQVAFVNIPHNRTTALIYGGSTEPHRNGQYFDDPSPYPEPEFSGIENYNNGIPQFASIYHQYQNVYADQNHKQVGGVIKVDTRPITPGEMINIQPSKPMDLIGMQNVKISAPPISFGAIQKDNDFDGYIIKHQTHNQGINTEKPNTSPNVFIGTNLHVNHNNRFNYNHDNGVTFSNVFHNINVSKEVDHNSANKIQNQLVNNHEIYKKPHVQPKPDYKLNNNIESHDYRRPLHDHRRIRPRPRPQYVKRPLRPKPKPEIAEYMTPPKINSADIYHETNLFNTPGGYPSHTINSDLNIYNQQNIPMQIPVNTHQIQNYTNTYNKNYNNVYNFDFVTSNDDFDGDDEREGDINEAGEVIQESNPRPLRPGQIPFEIMKIKNLTTTTLKPQDVKVSESNLVSTIRNKTTNTNEISSNFENEIFPQPILQKPRPFGMTQNRGENQTYIGQQNRIPSRNTKIPPIASTESHRYQKISYATTEKVFIRPKTTKYTTKIPYIIPTSQKTINKIPLSVIENGYSENVLYNVNRPKVTSLPIDVQTTATRKPTKIISPIQVDNFGTQTEKPFNGIYSKRPQDYSITKGVFNSNDIVSATQYYYSTTPKPSTTTPSQLDLNIGEVPPKYLLNDSFTPISDMEIMKPPPPSTSNVIKEINIEMLPPTFNSNSGNTIHDPNLILNTPSSTIKPFVPKPSEEMIPPPITTEVVIGMSPPAITTHRPLYRPKLSTVRPIYSLKLDPPKTTYDTSIHTSTTPRLYIRPKPTRKPVVYRPTTEYTTRYSVNRFENPGSNGNNINILTQYNKSSVPNKTDSMIKPQKPNLPLESESITRNLPESTTAKNIDPTEKANITDSKEDDSSKLLIITDPNESTNSSDDQFVYFIASNHGIKLSESNKTTTSKYPNSPEIITVKKPSPTVRPNDFSQKDIRPTSTKNSTTINARVEIITKDSDSSRIHYRPNKINDTTYRIEPSIITIDNFNQKPTKILDKAPVIPVNNRGGSVINTTPTIGHIYTDSTSSASTINFIGKLRDTKLSANVKQPNRTIINRIISIKPVSTKYVTYTTTSTLTITETSVIKTSGGPPSTITKVITKTEKVTLVDTITEVTTLLKPTNIVETITTTVDHFPPKLYTQGVKYGTVKSTTLSPSLDDDDFIITDTDRPNHVDEQDNDSILVVLTDKNSGGVLHRNEDKETDVRDEVVDNKVDKILIGGISIASLPSFETPFFGNKDKCSPECRASKNELCQKIDGVMRCICRPGFARMFPDHPCKPTYTYTLKIALERFGKEKLSYKDEFAHQNTSEYSKLMELTQEALDRMVMQSDLRDIYHGVSINGFEKGDENTLMNDFNLQLSDNTEEGRLTEIFKRYLRNNNYSLGGTELYTTREKIERLEAEDFNECSSILYHDCSEHAHCYNLRGTYTCSCKEGFADLSENILYPGRVCSAEMIGCEYCNYHGTCYNRGEDQVVCECFHWYAGQNCHINLKVLLIALVTLGTILFTLLLVCIILTCCRRKPKPSVMSSGMSFLPQRVGNHGSRRNTTLDRRAMIHDTSSESGQSETNTLTYAPKKPKKLKGALKKPKPKSITSDTENENIPCSIPDQKDRSLTVMIPRAKYHPAPPMSPHVNLTTFEKRRTSQVSSNEAKLLSYLDAGPSPDKSTPRKYSNAHSESYIEEKPLSRKTSGALISAGFEVSATVLNNNMGTLGTIATTCGTEADRSENATLIQKISADLLSNTTGTRSQFNTLRNALLDEDVIEDPMVNWMDTRITTVSEARSYDETTIQPPMKSFRNDYDSKPSSQHPNDEANTMAERDLGSTFLLPHTHLYKPDRGSDISGFESL